MRTKLAAFLLALVVCFATRSLYAQAAPKTTATKYSPYEREAIRQAKRALQTELEFSPEGKLIESVDIFRLDVFEERDPPSDVKDILNFFHATSRDYVIRREVLLQPGQRWIPTLVDETARNLRARAQLSLVLCLAMKGTTPDRVRLVVITKDVWSLRLNSQFTVTQYGIESLNLVPSESNFLGTHQSVLGRFGLDPATMTLGLGYRIPRFHGTRVALTVDGGVIVNRDSGVAEGSYGSVSAAQPLYSSLTAWSWGVSAGYSRGIARRFSRARLYLYDAPSTQAQDAIPYQWSSLSSSLGAQVTRSFGWEWKHDVSLAYQVSYRAFRPFDLSGYDPRAAQDFLTREMPVGEARSNPSIQYRTYTTNYLRIIDFEALGLQEDYNVGHNLVAIAYPVLRALGSTRDFFGVSVGAQYTFPVRDGLIRASAESTLEREPERISDANWTASLRAVTPRLGIGRLVLDAGVLSRYRNYLNRRTFIGGDSRLRGFPSSYLAGENYVVHNTEFRSRPIEILSCQFGLAVFHDVAAAFDDFDQIRGPSVRQSAIAQGVGGGLRLLFPQLDKVVLRADIGFPIHRPIDPVTRRPVDPFAFHFSFGQAFSFGGI